MLLPKHIKYILLSAFSCATSITLARQPFLFSEKNPLQKDLFHSKIIILFWQQWWFYLLCSAATAFFVWFAYHYRILQLRKEQSIRNKIAQDLHDNMGSALSSISVYTQVAKIHNTRYETERLENILERMSETSQDVIAEMNDIVWAINPGNDSMEKILQRMESFAKPLAAAKNISMNFDYDQHISSFNMEMEKRKNFYLIFREGFNNAIKYADAEKINVSIKKIRGHIFLVLKDDGKGFNIEKKLQNSSGISNMGGNGLRNMRIRAKKMKGECRIESSVNNGTQVTLFFPV